MIIYAGSLRVAEEDRGRFMALRRDQVAAARQKAGVLHYAISADPLDPGLVQVFECYEDEEALAAHESKHDRNHEVRVLEMQIYRYEPAGRSPLRLPDQEGRS